MKNTLFFLLVLVSISVTAQEKHLKNIQQLTFGGDNAEAYFSFDSKNLTFQCNNHAWGLKCDQIFNLNIAKAAADTTYRPPMIDL